MKPADAEVARRVRRWLAYGDEDLLLARHGFSLPGTPPYRLIAYHAQQCAEKHLKGYLVFHAIDFPYTHSLSRLLELVAEKAPWAEQLRAAEELSAYGITARYPGQDEEVSKAEARQAVETAASVRRAVRQAPAEEGWEPRESSFA